MNIVREEVVVKLGGKIEVTSPDLPEGAKADVLIFVESEVDKPKSMRSIIGSGKGCYKTPEEADAFLSSERDRWES